jgi:hypothetical protein
MKVAGAQARRLCGETARGDRLAIERAGKRTADRRSEARHENLVDCSTLFFRGGVHMVPVANISTRGAMILCALEPRIGESVIIRFEGCSPIYAVVKWVRDGRVGLAFGTELVIG